ncbi:MAG: hypothetical protein GQE15_07010 [Archangiaceae bacterium]|nr:hypothetical protein [Archangiaceae bacterium]
MGALLVVGCVRAPVQPVLPVEPPVLWVDAFAAEGGDGGVEAALKTVPLLREAARVHVRSGLYAGPFVFPAGTTLEGHGEAVLFLEGAGTVITANAPLELKHLSIQGGAVGVLATAPLSLAQVKFSGHRVAALQVFDAGVEARALEVASRLDTVGVDAINASVTVSGVKLDGPLSFGVRSADSTVRLSKVTSVGPSSVVQVQRGSLEVEGLDASGGMRTAISLSSARGVLSNLDVTGFEYAVLGVKSTVDVRHAKLRGARFCGASFLGSKPTFDDVFIERAGSGGGVQLLDSDSEVKTLTVSNSLSSGLLVRQGKARIGSLVVRDLRGEPGPDGALFSGDGLQVRDAQVELTSLEADTIDGAGVYASNVAKVVAGRIDVRSSGFGAAVVERKSMLFAETITSRASRGPSIAVPEDGLIDVKSLSAQGGDVSVWADCASGSFVTVGAVDEGTVLPRLTCLGRSKSK